MLNDEERYMKVPCLSSVGKRKVTSLSHDLHASELSITFVPQHKDHGDLRVNCWIKDEEDRQFGFVIKREALLELYKKLGRAIEEQKQYD